MKYIKNQLFPKNDENTFLEKIITYLIVFSIIIAVIETEKSFSYNYINTFLTNILKENNIIFNEPTKFVDELYDFIKIRNINKIDFEDLFFDFIFLSLNSKEATCQVMPPMVGAVPKRRQFERP